MCESITITYEIRAGRHKLISLTLITTMNPTPKNKIEVPQTEAELQALAGKLEDAYYISSASDNDNEISWADERARAIEKVFDLSPITIDEDGHVVPNPSFKSSNDEYPLPCEYSFQERLMIIIPMSISIVLGIATLSAIWMNIFPVAARNFLLFLINLAGVFRHNV